MSRLITFCLTFTLCVLTVGRNALADETRSQRPPNIVLLLVDDLGWTALTCYGSDLHETPHLDRLAKQGMRFTDAYAACTVCSPTRAAVLTGKYPARLHLTDWIAGHVRPRAKLRIPDWTKQLEHQEVTLAEALKPRGYVSASIGKWHLGNESHWPTSQGFDENVGGTHKGQPPSYFDPYGKGGGIPTLPPRQKGEFLTDRLTDEALGFIEKNKDRPFFLYLPYFTVHTPLMAKQELIDKYKARIEPNDKHRHPALAGMVDSLDQSVGRILAKLDELKLADNTVVIFTSDNGGLVLRNTTSNAPLRAGKGSAYEGGVRVPLIVRWPGVVEPGSTCSVPVISTDFYPTILQMTGVSPQAEHLAGHRPDGESLVPLLKQSGQLHRNAIYWHYPHYHPGGATPYGAVRDGSWKLIEFFEDDHVELYNLADDLGESNDLASKMPERAEALRRQLHEWRKEVGAQMPTPNSNYRGGDSP